MGGGRQYLDTPRLHDAVHNLSKGQTRYHQPNIFVYDHRPRYLWTLHGIHDHRPKFHLEDDEQQPTCSGPEFPRCKRNKIRQVIDTDGKAANVYHCLVGCQLVPAGINNFAGNVLLQDLQLPSDSPKGGIDFVAITQINNPR